MINKTITITTDFGDQFAASQLRAVAASLNFDGHLVENHGVTPYSITEGAFQITQIAKYAPDSSVHVGVVDPGVGSDRLGVVIETERSFLVGPNNGLLYPLANEEGIKGAWRVDESAFGDEVAATFHGRDVFVKIGVYLAQGKKPTYFGCQPITMDRLTRKEFIDGEVIHIDAYGNYKIHWSKNLIIGKELLIKSVSGREFVVPIVRTFTDVSANKPLALLGSHKTLEIAENLGNAKEYFEFRLGECLMIE